MSDAPASRHHRDLTGMLEALGFVETAHIDRKGGRVTLTFRPERRHCNNTGMVQGGFVTAWLDCAMSSAVFVKRGRGTTLASLEIKTAYYAPIRPGADVSVEGWIERMGARIAFLEGRVVDAAGKVLAKTSSTASVRSPRRDASRELESEYASVFPPCPPEHPPR